MNTKRKKNPIYNDIPDTASKIFPLPHKIRFLDAKTMVHFHNYFKSGTLFFKTADKFNFFALKTIITFANTISNQPKVLSFTKD